MEEHPKFSYLDGLYASFFSLAFYRDVLSRWQGFGFGYLFLLTAFTVCITSFVTLSRVNSFLLDPQEDGLSQLQQFGYEIAEQTPTLYWQNGELKSDAPNPSIISISAFGDALPFIMINTANDQEAFMTSEAAFMVGSDRLLMREGETKVEELVFSESDPVYNELQQHPIINGETIRIWTDGLQQQAQETRTTNIVVLGLVFCAFFVVIWIILRVILVLFLSLPLMLILNIMNRKMRYEDATRLLCVALTPVALIHLAATLIFPHSHIPFMPGSGIPSLIYLGITLAVAGFIASKCVPSTKAA